MSIRLSIRFVCQHECPILPPSCDPLPPCLCLSACLPTSQCTYPSNRPTLFYPQVPMDRVSIRSPPCRQVVLAAVSARAVEGLCDIIADRATASSASQQLGHAVYETGVRNGEAVGPCHGQCTCPNNISESHVQLYVWPYSPVA